jgi:hypothetical protein
MSKRLKTVQWILSQQDLQRTGDSAQELGYTDICLEVPTSRRGVK